MRPDEHLKQNSKAYNAIIAEWPVSRIEALAARLSPHKVSGLLGITKRTLKLLISGEYTPSATFCRRMEMIEKEAMAGGDLETDILPARSEMRRRMLLFRAWWMNRDPSRELPEITVRIHVSWGKGVVNNFELPVKTLPRLRLLEYSGFVDTVRAVTKSLRSVARGYGKLLWTETEESFWRAYSSNTLPAIVEQRLRIPVNAVRARKWRPVKHVGTDHS